MHLHQSSYPLLTTLILSVFTLNLGPLANADETEIRFHPNGQPASLTIGGQQQLKVSDPGKGFYLRIFNGVSVSDDKLDRVTRKGDTLVVTNQFNRPRFTFKVVEEPRHLSLHLIRAEGMPKDKGVSLALEAKLTRPLEAIEINPKMQAKVKGRVLDATWAYLWHTNPDDPMGGFSLYVKGKDADNDLALADIWATEPLPRPAGQSSWTSKDVLAWVDAYYERFSNLSEITLSAASPEELYYLTKQAEKANISRIYLHTDTWRKEYWPNLRTHVDVNLDVFPGGRSDLVKYADYLHDRGMFLRLHSVSGGVGWRDPNRVKNGVDEGLASWGKGQVEKPVKEKDTVIYFRPEPGTELPIYDNKRSRLSRNMPVDYITIGGELIRVGSFEDMDKPVWRLEGCTRGWRDSPVKNHRVGSEAVGLYSAYGMNLVPGLDSPLLEEIAREYADLVNEAHLDHLHFDGLEIHDIHKWGREKYSDLVYSMVKHPTTSSSSGGKHITANFERRFSKVRDMHELDYFAMHMSLNLDGHRPAASMLDIQYTVQAMLEHGTRRVHLQKPEPMFGLNREIMDTNGLTPAVLELARQWGEQVPYFGDKEAQALSKYMGPTTSKLNQRGRHYQSDDVLMLEKAGKGYQWVPTRVMMRETGDVPWTHGQEHGTNGPKQLVQPGQTLELINPYKEQTPGFIIRILSECVEKSANSRTARGSGKNTEAEDDYRTGAELAGQGKENSTGASTNITRSQPIQPKVTEIKNQRFTKFKQKGKALELTATNPTKKPILVEDDFPRWKPKFSMANGRGLAMDVTGDGSGAVLVISLRGRGMRDYVCKIDFTGKRKIIIPHGEAAWADGAWGWRFATKKFDYTRNVTEVRMGFGHIPAQTNPKIVVANLRTLVDRPVELKNPLIRVADGTLQIKGTVSTGDYIEYTGGSEVLVYDPNWNLITSLPVQIDQFIMPKGKAKVSVELAKGSPKPWIETQFITRGTPIPLPTPQSR